MTTCNWTKGRTAVRSNCRKGIGLLLLVGLLGLGAPGQTRAQDENTKPSLDPFVVLITKPKPPPAPRRPTTFRPAAPSRPRVPPLIIKINSIISAGDESLALIDYNGNDYVVGKGWEGDEGDSTFDKRFKVVEVDDEKIVVFDTMAKQRRTIRDSDSGPGGGVEISTE